MFAPIKKGSMSEISAVEETVKRLSSHKGVLGVLIISSEGIPVNSTLDPTLSVQYAALACQLSSTARRAVKELDHATVTLEMAAAAATEGMPGLASTLRTCHLSLFESSVFFMGELCTYPGGTSTTTNLSTQ